MQKEFSPFIQKIVYVPWWSPQLTALRKQVNALKCRAKRCNNPALKEITSTRYKVLKNSYRSELIKAKQNLGKKFGRTAPNTSNGNCTKCAKPNLPEPQYPHL